jgi:hypothetical protein
MLATTTSLSKYISLLLQAQHLTHNKKQVHNNLAIATSLSLNVTNFKQKASAYSYCHNLQAWVLLLQSCKPATKKKHKSLLLPHPSPIVVNLKQKMLAFKLAAKQKASA